MRGKVDGTSRHGFRNNKQEIIVNGKNVFPFGATYAPFYRSLAAPKNEWENDFKNMKEIGFTHVNVFAAWNKIERQEGVFDFTDLDEAVRLASKFGLEVSIKLAVFKSYSLYHPRWLMRSYQGQVVKCPNGENEVKHLHSLPCADDPLYQAMAKKYLEALVRHFLPDPAVVLWIVWGEPVSGGCWCPETIQRFRDWLKIKYQTLDNLNNAWNTEGTSDFISWDELEPPEGYYLYAGYLPTLDWQTFTEDNLAGNIQWVNDLVKGIDSTRPTMTEIGFYQDKNTVSGGNNLWKLAKTADLLGFSIFKDKDFIYSMAMDMVGSAARALGKDAWVVELQGGPTLFMANSAPKTPTPKQIAAKAWQMIAHGAHGLVYWTYRSRLSDHEGGEFGLANIDGTISDRLRQAGLTSVCIQDNSELFKAAGKKSEIAIFCSRLSEQLELIQNLGGQTYYTGSVIGAYQLLWHEKLSVDFVNTDILLHSNCNSYKFLLLPFLYAIDEKSAEAIKKFVYQGGTVIADFPCVIKDEKAICYRKRPGAGLDELFGAEIIDITSAGTSVITSDSDKKIKFQQSIYSCVLNLKTAQVLGVNENKEPSVIVNSYGKGKAVLAGTMLFYDYYTRQDENIGKFIARMLDDGGLNRDVVVENLSSEEYRNCEVTLLRSGEKFLLFAVNHNRNKIKFTVRTTKFGQGQMHDLLTGDKMIATCKSGYGRLTLTLEADQCRVLLLKR